MKLHIYTMTIARLNTIITREGHLNCQKCDKEIMIGDKVVTKAVSGVGHRKIRHEKCAKKVGLI